MERFFNTAGPQLPDDCYTINPLSRFDLDDVLNLIRQKRYFVFHAPWIPSSRRDLSRRPNIWTRSALWTKDI